jgi:hypothetical protein
MPKYLITVERVSQLVVEAPNEELAERYVIEEVDDEMLDRAHAAYDYSVSIALREDQAIIFRHHIEVPAEWVAAQSEE